MYYTCMCCMAHARALLQLPTITASDFVCYHRPSGGQDDRVCVPVQPLIGGGGGGDMIIMNDREHLWADTHCMWGGLWESLCASRLTCDVIGRNHTLK